MKEIKRENSTGSNNIVNASPRGSMAGSVGVGMDGTWSLGDPAGFWTRASFWGEGTERVFGFCDKTHRNLASRPYQMTLTYCFHLTSRLACHGRFVALNCSWPRGHQTKPLCNEANQCNENHLGTACSQAAFGPKNSKADKGDFAHRLSAARKDDRERGEYVEKLRG